MHHILLLHHIECEALVKLKPRTTVEGVRGCARYVGRVHSRCALYIRLACGCTWVDISLQLFLRSPNLVGYTSSDTATRKDAASSDFIVMNKATASSLAALQEDIRGAVETLDRIDEFLLPNESPDNSGLGFNLCAEATLTHTPNWL